MRFESFQVGELSYNGFLFPGAIKASVRGAPVEDITGRVAKYVRYTIRVETMLFPGVDTGNLDIFPETMTTADGQGDGLFGVEAVRRALMEYGKTLVFSGKGFGNDFKLNTAIQDVAFGPKPTTLVWEPVGGSKSVRIIWEVTATVAECPGIQRVQGKIAQFGYDVAWEIDDEGLTTRTISGEFEVLRPRVGNTFEGLIADEYRERLEFPIPERFRRVGQTYQMNSAGNMFQFRIVDREYAVRYTEVMPKGIVEADVRHSVSNITPMSFEVFMCELSGSFRMGSTLPKALGYLAFATILKAKRKPLPLKHKGKATLIWVSLRLEEDLFTNTVSFSARWRMHANIAFMVPGANYLRRIDHQYTWRGHKESLSREWSPRGRARLRARPPASVVSPCGSQSMSGEFLIDLGRDSETDESLVRIFRQECPAPEDSWLHYQPSVALVEDFRKRAMYPTGGIELNYDDVPGLTPGSVSQGSGFEDSPGFEGESPFRARIHQGGQAQARALFAGAAMRLGHPIPRIHLKKYGGAKAIEPLGTGIWSQRIVKTIDNCPVYLATWRTEYMLDKFPDGELIETDPNPFEFRQV